MITCADFRRRFTVDSSDAAVLEHLRACDACLAAAVEADPDAMFRSLGGEMVPPGGVDAFVGDVMRQVHLRSRETAMEPARTTFEWARRTAIAAAITAAVITGAMFYINDQPAPMAPRPAVAKIVPAEARPIIESYESQNATIVEVPAEQPDVKIVMIFDDNLPADL